MACIVALCYRTVVVSKSDPRPQWTSPREPERPLERPLASIATAQTDRATKRTRTGAEEPQTTCNLFTVQPLLYQRGAVQAKGCERTQSLLA